MLKKIIKEVFKLNEAQEVKEDSFKYFYIEDYDMDGNTYDINDLMSKDYINVILITDKNFAKEELTSADEFKIPTEELESYMTTIWDDYKSGDYMDFMGNFGLDDLIGGYLEDVHKKKWCKRYTELERLMDAENRIDMTEGKRRVSEASDSETYFDTFSAAVQFAREKAEQRGFEIDEDDWSREIAFGTGRPKNGSTTRASIGLSKNGKLQRKALHIQVFDRGTQNGNYELNWYIN